MHEPTNNRLLICYNFSVTFSTSLGTRVKHPDGNFPKSVEVIAVVEYAMLHRETGAS